MRERDRLWRNIQFCLTPDGKCIFFVCVSLLGWLVAVLTRSADTLVGHQTVYIKKGYQTKTLIQYSVLVCTHCALCNVASFSHLS
jgi:hypothetical protein